MNTINFADFVACGYMPKPVEDAKETYKLVDRRARLAAKGRWYGLSAFITDARDLLRDDSEAPYMLRFACAACKVRLT